MNTEIEIRHEKYHNALLNLEPNARCQIRGDINSQSDFENNIDWITGEENGIAITTNICPYNLTWTQIKAEMDSL